MDVRFSWVDVFAERPLTGNPLAVVPDADGLSDERMRAIAREFNQSETTFLVRPDLPGADHRLRSFTPGGAEVLGAGHNAMGAWIWLARSGLLDPGRDAFVQQIGGDTLPVRIVSRGEGGARVAMEQAAPRFPGPVDARDALAAALALDPADLAADRVPEVASTGVAHLLVPARDARAVDLADPDPARLRRLLADVGAEGCYLYTVDTAGLPPGVDAYARFFNPTVGIAEDPATGTAAGPLAAVLVRDGLKREGEAVTVEQGRAMGRPSRIGLTVGGGAVRITGSGVVVAEGTLHL
ncbi:phenazine biosynthesis protein PhzF family [Nocardiopsis flavescens]|uniref:Phenazine biosynthesis protein PhzF family n=1 Tax=Nocardiopsis flavescens TaxID=758803 RepID=A0A1M6M3M6_9ACTN|nr:PhzF family phenazine biosynthesis protein [Nocardiopsis flavescens]SHJ78036.1 phenazine biosynthesis protein PhzF family [Nocardiopsis flavescens]